MKRIKVADLPEFDAAPYLGSEAAIAAYLTDILEANDPALLSSALSDIARARGMSEIAKASGLTREALYKAQRPRGSKGVGNLFFLPCARKTYADLPVFLMRESSSHPQ